MRSPRPAPTKCADGDEKSVDRLPPIAPMSSGAAREITLRFLAAPTDVAKLSSTIHHGKLLEWIDKAGYACAVGWSRSYCVTAYVGNIRFARSVASGHLVEVNAKLVYTGRSSMHVLCRVAAADPRDAMFTEACSCLVIFVAVDEGGRSRAVPVWEPIDAVDRALADEARRAIGLRSEIEDMMRPQDYSGQSTSTCSLTRFMAAPTDVNWGGKVHGGNAMRWIDETATLCGMAWNGTECVSAYAGGVRFYRPIQIGHLVEVDARLLHTGEQTMHISIHVRSGDPRTLDMQLTTHCLTVLTALDDHGNVITVRPWLPRTEEDRRLDAHAVELAKVRTKLDGSPLFGRSIEAPV